MYSTCLFCNGAFGANEAIEAFPVGRRLAFDAAKGRLWVVCRRCERWNLTPLEERWEAIEQCERAFRDTRLRVSTDQIGLARLREGLELVRIGAPLRPEMAAWRYGDQFGRRRLRSLVVGGGAAVTVAGAMALSPMLGISTVGLVPFLPTLFNVLYSPQYRRGVTTVPVTGAAPIVIANADVGSSTIAWEPITRQWSLGLSHLVARQQWLLGTKVRITSTLSGDDALRAARLLMPTINASGAGKRIVAKAVDYLEQAPTPYSLFAHVAQDRATGKQSWATIGRSMELKNIPAAARLAMEMAANEETERRALQGELHLLAGAWRSAEEIAAIADDLLLPPSVDEQLARLKRDR